MIVFTTHLQSNLNSFIGDAKHIIPLMGDAAALARACMPKKSPVGVGGGGVIS